MNMLRMDRLGPDVLLCLFEGRAEYFDIHLKPESIHFGFSGPAAGQADTAYEKEICFQFSGSGETVKASKFKAPFGPVPIKWKSFPNTTGGTDPNPYRIVDLPTLKEDMLNQMMELEITELNSAQFALEMIQGVPKVVFAKSTST